MMDTMLRLLLSALTALRPHAMRSSVVLGSLCSTSNSTDDILWAGKSGLISAKKCVTLTFEFHVLSILPAGSLDVELFDSDAVGLSETPLSVLVTLISRS